MFQDALSPLPSMACVTAWSPVKMPCMVSSFDATFFSFTAIVVEAVHTAGKVDNLINAFPQ